MLNREYSINTKLAFTNKAVRWQGTTAGYRQDSGYFPQGTIVKLANASNVTMVEIDGSSDDSLNAGFMRIDGITFDGNKANQTTSTIDIIDIKACWGTTISNCNIINGERHGINVSSASNVLTIGPDNHILANGDITTRVGSGLNAASMADSVVMDNEISHSGLNNITIGSGNNTIKGNQCDDSGQHGISMSGRGLIVGNHCKNNDGCGIAIYSDHVTVTGNVCNSNGEDVNAAFTTIEESGILVDPHVGVTLVGNACHDDATWDGGNTQKYGIYVKNGVTYFSMVGNQAEGNVTDQIYMVDRSENQIANTISLREPVETMPYLIKEKVAVDCSSAANTFHIYAIPANHTFMPITVAARVDNDIAATNGDYWSVGVNAASRRVDYGVCTTTAAANKHSQNAKINWCGSPEKTNQVATGGETIKLMSVDGTGDAAALSNAMGGTAGDQVTVIITGWLLPDLADAS
jgi:hypothetical protein